MPNPFVLVSPGATRGIGLALTRQFLQRTTLPVYASHRRPGESDQALKKHILEPLGNRVDPSRLHLLHINLTSEETITNAAQALRESLEKHVGPDAYIQTAFITGGILFPEKSPAQLDLDRIHETFNINVISHMLMIKHFSSFLPPARLAVPKPSRWVHVSARVGSIEDNRLGGWYSYRSSKAALNQVIKTFDLDLKNHKKGAICVGVHPGTVKTDLSKGFWTPNEERKGLFEVDKAAENLINTVENLKEEQRGMVWDWAGTRVPW
ncbi:C factor cell-cell signaling protein [Coprinopsis sp. MPI-PUGE-AT-0042]|nr:C factor cell-cell signaling protein [Coprinopsis sp. MPI-PUGE-AT-0042]